ncbi:hypothetical protein B0H13DRAFT_2310253 [Mycena leptocephala]|nr:hypothetical protein B0H13DRAFT_2310253 [Mycena leptocephala]
MPPRRELPECYEQGADKKVRCKVCPNAKWAAYAKGHVEEHVRSSKHRQALESATARQAGQSNIERRLAGASSLSTVQPAAPADLTFANLRLPVFHPIAKTGPSEAEEGMWGDYSKYEAGFSAGDEISEDDVRRKFEQEMDMMGIWDAVELGRQLDGELEVSQNPAAEDDALLAELLQALDSDPFDATQTQTDPEKSAAWYPYPSKSMLLLDICDNLPRLPISESLMRTFIWILRECRAKDVPSLDALRKTQKNLRSCCGVPTIPCTSLQGNNFCLNDPKAIIRMECANPEIRSQFHLYPEINTNGSISEIWHGKKLLEELDPDFLTPMLEMQNGIHYYIHEVDSVMHVDTYPVEIDDQNRAHIKKSIIRVAASRLSSNFLDLESSNQVPAWSDTAVADGYPARMPNPLRAIAKGDPFYTILVDYFSDDVSGNRSKSWNKHWNAYMTNRSLPRELLQHEFYIHFVSTSQHASIPEQFKEFKKQIKETETDPIRAPDNTSSTGSSCYRIFVNTDPSDNPMQAEICSCMGAAANHPCRKCKVGGSQADKATNEGYHAMFASYTSTGVKDKYTEYWINDLLSQFKKAVESGKSKAQTTEELKQWVKDHADDIYSAFLTTDGFDPSRDTPIELLHTILLGVLKFLWHVTHTSWTPEQKKLFELRLQATNISGLSVESIRAGYIVQYANSLIGRQFKVLLQAAVFHIHDLVDETNFRAWKAIGDMAALLWVPEIDDMETYCADLHIAIGNFLDSFAEIDPTKMVVKVKTHLLTHAPADVRLFGLLLGAITEAFESFNAVFRGASILSNHRAPSRDIAIRLSALEGVKHRAAGGTWPIKGINNETIWTRCGPSARQLLQDHPILQRLMGWKKSQVLQPGPAWRPKRQIVVLHTTPAPLAFTVGITIPIPNGTAVDP